MSGERTEIRVVGNRSVRGGELEIIRSRCDFGEAERWCETFADDEAFSNVRIQKRTVIESDWEDHQGPGGTR